MQPVVQATTRTPGPSTAEPVVKEWRNPMSPVASAVRTSDSPTSAPRLTRSSYGLLAASGVRSELTSSGMATDRLLLRCSGDFNAAGPDQFCYHHGGPCRA